MSEKQTLPSWASLALTLALLALSLILMAGLVYAQSGSISGRVTDNGTEYAGFTGAWVDSQSAVQASEAVTMHMYTDPITNPQYANSLNDVFFFAYPLDKDDNWVANGTPVTVTYEWDWDEGGVWEVVKYTEEGYVTGGFMNVSSPGTITFTARANLTATAFVTMAFNYNPPDDISVAVDPDSITAGGATAVVTASVSGLHDGFASNGTVVNFETTLGTIDATALTTAGIATATLTSGSAEGTAVVTARVGELSDSSEVEITAIK
ncbi:MAG: Ig-like domain-containing protein, partial [Anaerolineae bacterium]